MRKRVLVCGSTGFIGRNIAESFAEDDNFEVYGTYFRSNPLKHSGIKMIKCDLSVQDDVEKAVEGKDIIIQAAAVTSGVKDILSKPFYHVRDNAVMNAFIFKAAFESKVEHFIFFSCTTMYQSGAAPLKEKDFDANQEINAHYFGGAWTKVYNEKMCEFYSRLGSGRYTVVRHSNIYGPYDKFRRQDSHVFAAIVSKVMDAKEGSEITVWGDGREERDLLYVSDLIDFVKQAILKQKAKFELFNAGYGEAVSVKALVEKIIRYSGKKLGIEYDSTKPSIKTKLCLDSSRARQILGWIPKVSIDEGIKRTLSWYKDNIK